MRKVPRRPIRTARVLWWDARLPPRRGDYLRTQRGTLYRILRVERDGARLRIRRCEAHHQPHPSRRVHGWRWTTRAMRLRGSAASPLLD